jgi:hypothetical protein
MPAGVTTERSRDQHNASALTRNQTSEIQFAAPLERSEIGKLPAALPRSADQKSLRSKSPQNGSIAPVGRRLSTDSRSGCLFSAFGD